MMKFVDEGETSAESGQKTVAALIIDFDDDDDKTQEIIINAKSKINLKTLNSSITHS